MTEVHGRIETDRRLETPSGIETSGEVVETSGEAPAPGESAASAEIGTLSETGPATGSGLPGGPLPGAGPRSASAPYTEIATFSEGGPAGTADGGGSAGAARPAGGEEAGEFSATWLGLREPADAAARALDLVERLPRTVRTVRDLGCGTGSLGRWLSPRLPAPQHWIMMDRDPALLLRAAAGMPDGITVSTRRMDVTDLTAADLAGTDLVTCSALLDLLTAGEVERLAAVCAEARVSVLFTLSVTGEVRLAPVDPLDAEIEAAFNAHQRREEDGRRLLGPDAPEVAAAAFERVGARVTVRPSPWRLGPALPALTAEWLRGWVAAARQERPDLPLGGYLERRTAALPHVSVGHKDVLAIFD